MRAHQIMTRPVVTITPDATILEAANTMLRAPCQRAPRGRCGRQARRHRLGRRLHSSQRDRHAAQAQPLAQISAGRRCRATDYVREHGRKVSEVMTSEPLTIAEDATLEEIVTSMETNGIKRLPVMRGDKLVGIVSRANLLQAVASLAREIPDPTADDDHIRNRIIQALEKHDWSPFGLNVIVRDGIVHLSGVITDENSRQAAMVAAENVAGVRKVHDHLCWVDTMSGMYLESPEDVEMAKTG